MNTSLATARASLCTAMLLSLSAVHAQVAPQPSATATANAAPVPAARPEDVVGLSPFEVNAEKDNGFAATNAGTATKLGLDMRDLAAPYSVMTGEFIQALGITDMQNAVLWSASGSPVLDGQGADQFNAPVMYNVRGALQNVGQQRNFFTTASIGDTYNTERIDFGRGPNAVLFNTGASNVLGGGISSSTKHAQLDRDFETMAFTGGSFSYYRSTLDVNRKLTDKLAVRGNAVWQDKGGWFREQFDRRKGLTVAATYRLSSKDEFRVEGENVKFVRNNPTYPMLDTNSGWDGATVFNGPITNAMLSSTATPGANYGLTYSGSPQGVSRSGVNYVYIPGQNTIMNWVDTGLTQRGDNNNRVPIYSGGQVWSRNGDANLLPFGNASNQSNTPAIMDNGASNGPTILYSTFLPGDRFDNVIAHSKFKTPDKRFTNMPTDPLFTQWVQDANLAYTHRFSDTLFFEFAADYNRVHNKVVNNINGFRNSTIDLNRNLPDGTPNPNFLQPYGEGQERIKDFYIDNGQVRAVLNYIKDLGKWGSYTFNLSGAQIERITKGRQAVDSIAIAADPREWQGQAISIRNYWSATNRSFLPATGLPTNFFNVVPDSTGNNLAASAGTIHPHYVLNSWDDSTQITNSGILAMAGRWFHNSLVVTAGVRDDAYRNETRTGLRQGSLPNNASWDGFALDDRYWRATAPKDWATLTYIPKNADGSPASKVPLLATTRPTIAGANGVNLPNPLYANDRFRDDYNNPDRTGNGLSKTVGVVYYPPVRALSWVGLKLNYGSNYAVRAAGQWDLYGTDAEPETGLAKEIALPLTFFNGGLTLTPRYYYNQWNNRLGDPATTGPINTLMSAHDYADANAQGRNLLGFTNVLGQDYYSTLNTGYEVEFAGRITRGWRLSGSLGTARSKDYNRWMNTQAYVRSRADEFKQVLLRAGGLLDASQKNPFAPSAPGLAIVNPAITATFQTDQQNAVTAYNSIWAAYDSIPLLQDTIGVEKLTWKVLTDYTIQEGRLRGLRIGLAANFVDRNLAGYRSADTIANPNFDKTKPVSATNLPYQDNPTVDANSPVWFKQPFEITGMLGYSMRLKSGSAMLQGRELSFNLVVRNLMNWQKVFRQDTGLALRPPNGDLSLPYRVSVPSRVGQFEIPINFECTATLKM